MTRHLFNKMVNEHYVPQVYLRLFSPPDEGHISRYSLVDKHAGGDYHPPIDRYSVREAASQEDFADGWLDRDEINRMEEGLVKALDKITRQTSLNEEDIACISQFLAFQHDRTPDTRLHYEGRQLLGVLVDNSTDIEDFTLDQGWESVLTHNVNKGHETLQHMGWLLVKNNTEMPFITSDSPVTHYFCLDYEDVTSTVRQNEGREVYCPVSPNHLLVLLDPCRYNVSGQHPKTDLKQITVNNQEDIHEINRLQGLTAFQEVFGPVGMGDYLEQIIAELCDEFPDEDFVRGNRADIKTLQLAQSLACGFAYTPWYKKYGKPLIQSKQKKAHAIWEFKHNISFVKELRREESNKDYWNKTIGE